MKRRGEERGEKGRRGKGGKKKREEERDEKERRGKGWKEEKRRGKV